MPSPSGRRAIAIRARAQRHRGGARPARRHRLDDVQVIFRQQPKVAAVAHFGGRLVFGRDGRLFVTLGDRLLRRDDAQKLDSHLGKVVRIEADGRVPADNPFAKTPGAKPEIWSIGHRNVQGAALHPGSGALWTHEHGPKAATKSTSTKPAATTAGRWCRTASTTAAARKIGEGTTQARHRSRR